MSSQSNNNNLENPRLLSFIAKRFESLRQEEIQSKKSARMTRQNSVPLNNGCLRPNALKVDKATIRLFHNMTLNNEKLIKKGQKPVNIMEKITKSLRPMKRKALLVELAKLSGENVSLGVNPEQAEKILRNHRRSQIITKLNKEYFAKCDQELAEK
jgi:hypothetical protein